MSTTDCNELMSMKMLSLKRFLKIELQDVSVEISALLIIIPFCPLASPSN